MTLSASMKIGTAVVEVEIPVRILSEMNRRDHWRKRNARFRAQQTEVFFALRVFAEAMKLITSGDAEIVVTLTRLDPQMLDTDNLASGFKAVRDQVAKQLGIDDGSDRIEWIYRQAKARTYSAQIRIERGGDRLMRK
jgi:hypothetical protein